MRLLRIVPDDTKFDFMRFRRISFPISAMLSIAAILLYFFHGLNFGIDFVGGTLVEVQTKANPADLANAMVREIHAVDAGVPVYDIRTIEERLYDSLARQRFATAMLGAFAAFALLLAAVGVYGVISYLVTQSTHDIGVRVALGARPADILGLVVRQGMVLAAVGIVVGLIGSAALTRVMASLLFGVSATDAVTFGSVAAILVAVVCAATVIPARRATGVDPMVALREE